MNLQIQFTRDLRSFSKPVWMFLAATALNGLVMSIRALFFNFFILSLGYDREFLGLANAVAPASAIIMGIPLGLLMDRVGERRAMLFGLVLTVVGMTGQVLILQPVIILMAGFIMGAGNLLFTLSQAPFIVRSTSGELRIKLLSVNFGLFMLAGIVGNILGGQLPVLFNHLLNFSLKSPGNYQVVLLTAAGLELFALLPLIFMDEPRGERVGPGHLVGSPREMLRRSFVRKLILIEFLVGIGASVLLPYMNLYFAERFHYSDQTIGLILGSSALITGVASFSAPRILRFYRYRIRALVTNQSISHIFLFILSVTPIGWMAAACYLMRDLFMKTGSPLLDSFSMEYVPQHERGMMSSIVRFAFTCGSAFGPYLSGWVQNRAGFTPLFYIMLFFYGISTLLLWFFFWNFEMNQEQDRAGLGNYKFV